MPYQHTVANRVTCRGVGLHSGEEVSLSILPAVENTGILFRRVDISGPEQYVPANYLNVVNTQLGTTLANDKGVSIATTEHLMAALWGCNIDNAIVELSGPEVPIMDGSSEPFVFLIECSGTHKQEVPRRIIEVLKTISVEEDDKRAVITPADDFTVTMEIDFENALIAKQHCVFHSSDVSFKTDLCRARTFGFEHEVSHLRAQGLARGGSLENAVVVSGDKVLNKEGLRYSNEFVRHKVLDCIGDFYLIGGLLKGHFTGFRSGHALNNKLLRAFFADRDAWRILRFPETPNYFPLAGAA
ncbi:MAG: UDP-3-O-acyl-N-acetylglucosamine deacetylase [Hyphomicrobiales bacterium]|nr:UDP-3-O-acyl-N-acetylglucosamine deacetylase [Hyphomicrobiales bacterium]